MSTTPDAIERERELTPGLPPGPPGSAIWPLVAGARLFAGRFQLGDLAGLRRRYGDMFTVNFVPGLGKAVLVGHPDLVKQVFTADSRTLHAGEHSPLRRVLGGDSLPAIDEDTHLEQRKLVMTPFHGERMRGHEAVVEEEALREIATWPEGESHRTLESFMRITLEVILRAVFGASGPEMDGIRRQLRDEVPRAVKLGSLLLGLPPVLQRDYGGHGPWAQLEDLRRRFGWAVNGLVDRARSDPDLAKREDVLALFAQATHEDGTPMSDAEITDQLITLIAAGYETTATTLGWAIERIRRHSALLRRLVEEADAGGDELRKATIAEVQRTRPTIIGAGREVKMPFPLGEYLLPRGTMIAISASLLHTDPRNYPNPERFDPDRFAGRKPSPYAWVPSGGGVRRCLGAAFAQMQMDIVLRTILRNVELTPTQEDNERWSFRGLTFAPNRGGVAVIRRRNDGALARSRGARAGERTMSD